MGESAYTKGPWTRDRFDELRAADGQLVRFRGMANIMAGSDASIARAKANTRIADAAPDLVEALKALVDVCERQPRLHKRLPDAGSPLGLARAALSRALGKEG
jgi:hypothetical protein